MVSATGVVAHFDLRVGNPTRYHRLQFLRVHHYPRILTRIPPANPHGQEVAPA
jgi:hypothetical protein